MEQDRKPTVENVNQNTCLKDYDWNYINDL